MDLSFVTDVDQQSHSVLPFPLATLDRKSNKCNQSSDSGSRMRIPYDGETEGPQGTFLSRGFVIYPPIRVIEGLPHFAMQCIHCWQRPHQPCIYLSESSVWHDTSLPVLLLLMKYSRLVMVRMINISFMPGQSLSERVTISALLQPQVQSIAVFIQFLMADIRRLEYGFVFNIKIILTRQTRQDNGIY